jgi:hypothetical protein
LIATHPAFGRFYAVPDGSSASGMAWLDAHIFECLAIVAFIVGTALGWRWRGRL